MPGRTSTPEVRARATFCRFSASSRQTSVWTLEVGRSFSSLTLYENGRVIPPALVMCKLADLYGVDVADLLEDDQAAANG